MTDNENPTTGETSPSPAAIAELLRLTGLPVPKRVSGQSLRHLERLGMIKKVSGSWQLLPKGMALVPQPIFADLPTGASVVLGYHDSGSGSVSGVVVTVDTGGHRLFIDPAEGEWQREWTSWDHVLVLQVGPSPRLRLRRALDGSLTMLDGEDEAVVATGLSDIDVRSLRVQLMQLTPPISFRDLVPVQVKRRTQG